MKAKTLLLLLISLSVLTNAQTKKANLPYSIKGKIEGLQNVDIYLANYYGDKVYYNDTCHIDAKGNYEFEGKPFKECGKYAIVLPGPHLVNFIATTEQIVINCSADGDLNKTEVLQSKENKLFYDYIRYINDKRNKRIPIDNCLNDSLKSEEEKKPCLDEFTKMNNEVINYQKELIKNNPTSLFGKYLRMGMADDIPNAPADIAEDKKQLWQYNWYRNHYWDRCDLTDPRMIRDEAFHKLLDDYITKTLPQIPDTVCAGVKKILDATAGNEETFKYITFLATYTGETSKIMCMDELFVFMIDNYYSKGKCNWVKEDKLKEMKEAADKKRDCRCGEIAPDIILPDTTEQNWVSMYKSRGEYTLLLVWESSCGHCKKEVPLLLDLYHKYKDKGFVVYAIGHDFENDKWIEFVNNHKLDWINVSDTPEIMKQEKATELIYSGVTTLKSLNYRTTWDVSSTPKVFLMDKDMKIIAKSLSAEQLDQLLENLYKGEKVETNKFQETEYEDVNAQPKK